MTAIELRKNFQRQVDKTSGLTTAFFTQAETEYWLQSAMEKFIKTRYSGVNTKREGFEQSQKRTDDLRMLVKSNELGPSSKKTLNYIDNCYEYDYPNDYWFTLSEQITLNGFPIDGCPGNVKLAGVLEKTMDTYLPEYNNSLSERHFHNGQASPIRINRDNTVILITDDHYGVEHFVLTYIVNPTLDSNGNKMENGTDMIMMYMPDHTHDEIVILAAQLALENISDPRQQTHAGVEGTME